MTPKGALVIAGLSGLVPEKVLVDLMRPVRLSMPSQETHERDRQLAKAEEKRKRKAEKLEWH